MSFVEKFLAEKNGYDLSKAQIAASQNALIEFSKALNHRATQVIYTNMPAYVPANKFSVDGGIRIGDKHFNTSTEDKSKNKIEIIELVKTSYDKLSYALDNPFIKDHLADNTKVLKAGLNEAAQTGDYSKIDKFFDSFSNLAKRPSGVSAKLINLSSLEKSNPAPTKVGQGLSFVDKVTSTIRNLAAHSRS